MCGSRALLAVVTCLVLCGPACGGRAASKDAPRQGGDPQLPAIQIARDRPLVYTFRAGKEFRTVQSFDEVPVEVRGWVRVQDPSQPAVGTDLVYVADLRKADEKGRFPYRVLPRDDFMKGHPLPEMGAPGMGASAVPTDTVVLYSRPGCSACDSARSYLTQQGIPFVEKDVQKDPAAARELAEKARLKGIPGNVVPVLDVNGELVVGMDAQKLDRLLRRQI